MLKFHLITQFKFHLITQFPAVALPLGVNIRRCSHKKPKLLDEFTIRKLRHFGLLVKRLGEDGVNYVNVAACCSHRLPATPKLDVCHTPPLQLIVGGRARTKRMWCKLDCKPVANFKLATIFVNTSIITELK